MLLSLIYPQKTSVLRGHLDLHQRVTCQDNLLNGKVRTAQRTLSGENNFGLLSLDESISDGDVSHKSVRDILKEKHPDPAPSYEEAILDLKCQPSEVHSILFDKMALKCSGAAGPSGPDASDWRRLCTGFQNKSLDLCNSLASVAHRISTEFILTLVGLLPRLLVD